MTLRDYIAHLIALGVAQPHTLDFEVVANTNHVLGIYKPVNHTPVLGYYEKLSATCGNFVSKLDGTDTVNAVCVNQINN